MLNYQRVFCRIFIVIKIMKNLWFSGVPTLLKLLRLLITNRNECDTHLKASTTSLFSTSDTPWSMFVGPYLHWWWSKPCRCFMWFVVQSCFFCLELQMHPRRLWYPAAFWTTWCPSHRARTFPSWTPWRPVQKLMTFRCICSLQKTWFNHV